jgi:hypothetical protein
MNSSPEREGVESNGDLALLRNRYEELHSNGLHDDDQSLNRLLEQSSGMCVRLYCSSFYHSARTS